LYSAHALVIILDTIIVITFNILVYFVTSILWPHRTETESAAISWNETFSKFEPHTGGIIFEK